MVVLRLYENVNISERARSRVGVEIGDEGPAFEDDEFDSTLLEGCEEIGKVVFVEQVVGEGLVIFSC